MKKFNLILKFLINLKLLLFHIHYNIVNMTSEIIQIVACKVLDTLASYFHENSF
jgi:hypothetical protein